ncbi:unnamed protein product [Arctia plantaginis]|uniref:Uncharacterized protein n=1 Tax=Arctia plantaginis TaxID=874455 RepID=A0A8S0YLF0_ARCPL|nr:unnamed protein product [Arctia plantaginis]
MRTVDPELWSQKLKKPAIKVTRSNNFGQYLGIRYERIIRKSLVDAAKEFWANCSMPLVKIINLEDNSKLERYCYIFLLVLSLGLGIVIVPHTCYKFYTIPPLVINGLPSQASIAKVHFPAVALCSNNVISGTALNNYTEYLFKYKFYTYYIDVSDATYA